MGPSGGHLGLGIEQADGRRFDGRSWWSVRWHRQGASPEARPDEDHRGRGPGQRSRVRSARWRRGGGQGCDWLGPHIEGRADRRDGRPRPRRQRGPAVDLRGQHGPGDADTRPDGRVPRQQPDPSRPPDGARRRRAGHQRPPGQPALRPRPGRGARQAPPDAGGHQGAARSGRRSDQPARGRGNDPLRAAGPRCGREARGTTGSGSDEHPEGSDATRC